MPADEHKKSRTQFTYAEPDQELKELFLKVESLSADQATDPINETAAENTAAAELTPIAERVQAAEADKEQTVAAANIETVTLADFLGESSGPFSKGEAVELVIQICDLCQLSSPSGELSPILIYLDPAKKLSALSLTKAGGKSEDAYRAPEIKQGRGACSSSDVYSLGVILYEILSNKDHSAAQNSELAADIGKWLAHSPSWNTVPSALKQIIRSCLHEDPALRYSRVSDLADALNRYLRPHSGMALPASRSTAASRAQELRFAIKTAALAFLIAFASQNYLQEQNRPGPVPIAPIELDRPVISTILSTDLLLGTYKGSVGYDFRESDSTTTIFRRGSDGLLEGEYTVTEPEGDFRGTLKQVGERDGKLFLEWTDKYGSGDLVIKPDENGTFTGYWTHSGRTIGSWNGTLQ